MAELDLTNIAAASIATPAAGVTAIFTDTADLRTKVKDANGVVSTLNHDGTKDINILDNGGFSVQQRVATASTAIPSVSTTTRAGQVADRWAVTASVATNLNWAQIDSINTPETGLTARHYGSIISSTAGKKVMISQFILGSAIAHLRGQMVRVSIKHNQKVGSGQTYKLGLLYLTAAGTVDVCPAFLSGAWSTTTGIDPAWGTNLLAITPDAAPVGENGTITGSFLNVTTVATTWTKSSAVFTVPTTAKNLCVVFFSDATGGTTDNISITEAQLTQGPELVDFVMHPLPIEVFRCQRFFNKSFALTTVPVTNAGINTGEIKAVAGKAGAVANACIFAWRFPMVMWKTPTTVTIFNPAAANALGRNITGTADLGATALTAQLDSSAMAISTGVAATAVGDQCGIHYTADAEFVT